MKCILVIAIVAAACCTAVGETNVGGFSPVGPDDTAIVNKCADKIMATLLEKQKSANSGYEVKLTMPKKDVQKQVVNGMNYQFKFTARVTFQCATGSNCLPKKSVDKQCTATVNVPTDTSKPLTYVSGKEPTCS